MVLKLFSYLGTCFLSLSVVQFLFSFTILKNNHLYFEFFCQLCCGLFFAAFFIDRVLTVETTSAKFQKMNVYYFLLCFLFFIKVFVLIFKTTSMFINFQLKVCYYNNKVGTGLNVFLDMLDLFLLFLVVKN